VDVVTTNFIKFQVDGGLFVAVAALCIQGISSSVSEKSTTPSLGC